MRYKIKFDKTLIILIIVLVLEISSFFIFPEVYGYLNDFFTNLIKEYYLATFAVLIVIYIVIFQIKFRKSITVKQKKSYGAYNYIGYALGAFYLIFFTFIQLTLFFIEDAKEVGNIEIYQKVGNDFAGLSALVSALSFAAFFITLLMQSKQISLQSEEMEKNTSALIQQREEFEKTNSHYEQMRYNDVFYKLFDIFIRSLENVSIEYSESEATRLNKNIPSLNFIGAKDEKNYHGRNAFIIKNNYPNFDLMGLKASIASLFNLLLFVNKLEKTHTEISIEFYTIIQSAMTPHENAVIVNHYIKELSWAKDKMGELLEKLAKNSLPNIL